MAKFLTKIAERGKNGVDLTSGSVTKGIISFALPFFIGQLLQQMYALTDAWVIGHFGSNESFAAVNSFGALNLLIVGFFSGFAVGGGVVISKHFGAKDDEGTKKSIHNVFFLGIIASILCTVIGLVGAPLVISQMNVPDAVLPAALSYYGIYFAGISTVIMYNICMSIMRSLGDSTRPTVFLFISTVINVVMDMIFVALLRLDVVGAAVATVISQAISSALCIIAISNKNQKYPLRLRSLVPEWKMCVEIFKQGLPTGFQNSVISIGNLVVQSNINLFGEFAMSGHGAYAKIEGFVFLPITSMSMTLPTFISQNIGAKKLDRAKKGARFGILSGMILAEAIGLVVFFTAPSLIRIFVSSPDAVKFGTIHARTVGLFFFLLAFSHCASGVLRGIGKSYIPMITMLTFWCVVRVIYITISVNLIGKFEVISAAYPLTWALSTIVLLICYVGFEKKKSIE